MYITPNNQGGRQIFKICSCIKSVAGIARKQCKLREGTNSVKLKGAGYGGRR